MEESLWDKKTILDPKQIRTYGEHRCKNPNCPKKTFTRTNPCQEYCSDACRQEAFKLKNGWRTMKTILVCVWCHKKYLGRKDQVMCSNDCAQEYNKMKQKIYRHLQFEGYKVELEKLDRQGQNYSYLSKLRAWVSEEDA